MLYYAETCLLQNIALPAINNASFNAHSEPPFSCSEEGAQSLHFPTSGEGVMGIFGYVQNLACLIKRNMLCINQNLGILLP